MSVYFPGPRASIRSKFHWKSSWSHICWSILTWFITKRLEKKEKKKIPKEREGIFSLLFVLTQKKKIKKEKKAWRLEDHHNYIPVKFYFYSSLLLVEIPEIFQMRKSYKYSTQPLSS